MCGLGQNWPSCGRQLHRLRDAGRRSVGATVFLHKTCAQLLGDQAGTIRLRLKHIPANTPGVTEWGWGWWGEGGGDCGSCRSPGRTFEQLLPHITYHVCVWGGGGGGGGSLEGLACVRTSSSNSLYRRSYVLDCVGFCVGSCSHGNIVTVIGRMCSNSFTLKFACEAVRMDS